jgi:hypothetical protein
VREHRAHSIEGGAIDRRTVQRENPGKAAHQRIPRAARLKDPRISCAPR